MHNTLVYRRTAYFALAVTIIAAFSYMISRDHAQVSALDLKAIPTAIASSDRLQNNLSMFLKIDGVQGDSTDAKHRGEIEVDSYSLTVNRGLGSKAPTMQAFTLTLPPSSASPQLFLRTAGAVKSQRATLTVRSGGDDILTWILTDVTPLSYQTVGNTHGDGVTDAITLGFAKIEAVYNSSTGTSKTGWDQRSNKAVSN